MPDVIIKGMEMPKSCWPDCPCLNGDEVVCQAVEGLLDIGVLWTTRPDWCPLRPAQEWISVEERLPEQRINQHTLDFEYVLCSTTFGDVRPYKYGRRIGRGGAHFWNGAGYVDAYVAHWMPLPKPPEEETL